MEGTQNGDKQEDARALRGEYLRLDRDLDLNRDEFAEIGEDGKDKFTEALDNLEGLRAQVHRPREFVNDTRVYQKFAYVGAERARKALQSASKETAGHLITALGARFLTGDAQDAEGNVDPTAFDWKAVSGIVDYLYRPAIGQGGLLGPLDVQQKEAKARAAPQRRVKEPDAPVVRVAEVHNVDEREKQETDKNMTQMGKIVQGRAKEGKATRLLDLVLNYKSFAQTIENLFALSFLVKDGRVGISESDEGLLVSPFIKGKEGNQVKASAAGMQFVVSIDMEDWEALKSHTTEDQCLMPHRASYAGKARIVDRPEEEEEEERGGVGAGPSGQATQQRNATAVPRPTPAAQQLAGKKRARDEDEGAGFDEGTRDSPPEAVKAMQMGSIRKTGRGGIRASLTPVKRPMAALC